MGPGSGRAAAAEGRVDGGSKGIAAGVILGGFLGGATGNLLDQRDQKMAMEASHRALEAAPTGQATAWRNPDTGNSGTVTPQRTYQAPNGEYCREYTQQVMIGGKKETYYGTACRQPDGAWKTVS